AAQPAPAAPAGPVTMQQLRDAWPEILEAVQKASRSSWLVVYTATPRSLDDDVLTLAFRSQSDVAVFRPKPGSTESVSEHLRSAIADVLGLRVKFLPRVEESRSDDPQPEERPAAPRVEERPAQRDASRDVPAEPPAPSPESPALSPAPPAPSPAPPAPSPEPTPPAQIDADGWAVVSIPTYD
ncbi:hypothetical protein ACOI9R_36595, partial [Mesorhizobium japonicum]